MNLPNYNDTKQSDLQWLSDGLVVLFFMLLAMPLGIISPICKLVFGVDFTQTKQPSDKRKH